jgi:isopropylmalate/homocitrate/citramalate synthase
MPEHARRPHAERFYTSALNCDAAVTADERFHLPIVLQDVTLREGEQAAAVAFSSADKVAIAQQLDALGVPIIQVGYAGQHSDAVAAIKRAGVRARLSVLLVAFNADWPEAAASAIDAGADDVLVLFRSSDAQLALLGIDREEALRRATAAIAYCRARGAPRVVFEPSFVTAADPAFLRRFYRAAWEAGAEALEITDSTGIAKPATVRYLVQLVREVAPAPIGVHMHNDFGLAVACTLAGLAAGAQRADVSVLGLGERAGNTALEELVLALEGLYGINTGIRTEGLRELCLLVSRLTGVPIPANKPVVGDDVFAQKLEIHVRVTTRDPRLHEPFSPEVVGHRRVLKLGRGTGPSAVRAKLAELGLRVPEEQIDTLVRLVNEWALAHKAALSDEQFATLVQTL